MTLNKKTIKSVCSHMSQSGPRWEPVLGLQVPWGKAIAAFAPDVRALQNPNLEGEGVAQNVLENHHNMKQFLKRPAPCLGVVHTEL